MKQDSCQNIDLFQTNFGETMLAKQPLKNTRVHNNVRTAQSFQFSVCLQIGGGGVGVVVVANVSWALIFSQDSRSHKSGGGLETIAIIPIAGYI